jgi:hypothetical protein
MRSWSRPAGIRGSAPSFAPGWTTRALGGAALGGPMLVRMHLAYEF